MKKKIKYLFFDLDGTLIDSMEGVIKGFEYALKSLGIELPPIEVLRATLGPPMRENFFQLIPNATAELVEKAVAFSRERYQSLGIREFTFYPEVLNTLEQSLKKHLNNYIVTSKSIGFAKTIVESTPLVRLVQKVYGAELDGTYDNKKDLINHILKNEMLDPHEIIMIGDRSHDVSGAKANGIKTIGVSYGYGTREELSGAGADYIIDNLSEIFPIIEKEV